MQNAISSLQAWRLPLAIEVLCLPHEERELHSPCSIRATSWISRSSTTALPSYILRAVDVQADLVANLGFSQGQH